MFKKIIISLIVLLCSGYYISLHSTKIDTLSHYVKNSNVVYYKKDVGEYLTRFIPNGEFEISAVTIYLEGKKDETVSLKIYDGELGRLFPKSKKNLRITRNITKKIDGFEKIDVYFEDKIVVSKKEFFIAVSKECGQQVYLASDKIEKIPFCYIDSLNFISDQILLDCNNRYISCKYSFFVDVLGTYKNDETTKAFQRKFDCFDGSEFIYDNQSITCLDINNDNKNDIVINGKIYLNKKDFEFELLESEEIDSLTSFLNFSLDIDNSGDKEIFFINNQNNGYYTYSSDKFFDVQLPEIVFPSQCLVFDFNQDDYQDILIVHKPDSIKNTILLLMNDTRSGFFDKSEVINHHLDDAELVCCNLFDINGDAKLDLVVQYFDKQIQLLMNTGKEFRLINQYAAADSGIVAGFDILSKTEDIGVLRKNVFETNDLSTIEEFEINDNSQDVIDTYEYSCPDIQTDAAYNILAENLDNDLKEDIIISSGISCFNGGLYLSSIDNVSNLSDLAGTPLISFGKSVLVNDLNSDGKNDMLFIQDKQIFCYENIASDLNNFVKIDYGKSNSAEDGTVVVYSGNDVIEKKLSYSKGFLVQNPKELIIGLDNKDVDSVLIYNSGNGFSKMFRDVETNTELVIDDEQEENSQTGEIQIQEVFPMPFENEINFSIISELDVRIHFELFNTNGGFIRKIGKANVSEGRNTISFKCGANLSQGTYLVKLSYNNRSQIIKVIKDNK